MSELLIVVSRYSHASNKATKLIELKVLNILKIKIVFLTSSACDEKKHFQTRE